GDMLALGGMTLYRRPMAFVRALLQRHRDTGEPRDLTLLAFTAGLESDLLVGSGMISRVRSCYFGLEIFGLAPMFTYLANRGEIEIIEETEASLAFGLRAQMAGIGFMPGRGWLGTDLPQLRPDVRTIRDPYSGEELMAFPAIRPDIAVIHALQADAEGNARIGDNKGVDEELALTANTVIVTADEIVPELSQADLAAPWVDAIVHAPLGAAPTSCHPLYPLDGEAILAYTEQVSDPQSWQIYMDQYAKVEIGG
ncbi:MAG: malonate decarboxylase subunit alpha, partial [Chloroflexi bacterium]|nr:malonate decarboxylase subunit alpha [Chloroflexota bacterium]